MNRVLSLPHTTIFPGFLEAMKKAKRSTVVTEEGTIRIDHYLGPVEMKFSMPEHQLTPGTKVYVWWKGGGFVCAPMKEVKAEKREEKRIAERVQQARSQLAAARQARQVVQIDPAVTQTLRNRSENLIGVNASQFTPSLLSI